MRFAFILAALLSGAVQAQTIGVHLFSEHSEDTFERRYKDTGRVEQVAYNERNFGAYYISRDGWIVGVYDNSYYRTTVYAGYMLDGPRFGPVGTHLAAALGTGYEWCPGTGKLRPMLMPSLTVATPLGVSLRYSVAPAKGGVFQHLSIERKF
jgi:hypothetical protein